VTTLVDLQTDLFPGARPLGDPTAAQRPIAWVRVMKARVPAFDALDAGDIAIVPATALAVVAPAAGELEPIVAAFAGAPVSGVLLLEGDSPAASRLDELAAAIAAAGMAGLRLPSADPSAIERSVIGCLVGRASELERQAGLLEAELERRALAGEDAAGLIAAAATFLARALVLESPRGEPLAVHAPAQVPDAGGAVAAYASSRSGGRDAIALRVTLPSGGAIGLLGPRPPTDLERAALGRVAGLLALELARDDAVRRAADRGSRAETLPSGGPPWVVALARQRDPAVDADDAADRERREQVRRELRLLAPARRLALRGDADSLEIRLVAAVGVPGQADDLVGRIAALLGRTVALSRPFANPADRPTAEAEARTTLEAALALPAPPSVARAERLAAYRLMGSLHNLPDGPRLARAILEPLLSGRPDVRRERLATLRAILERGGVNEAAAALGVHRNTVAYRLRRIEELTGWRLTDPELRVPLAVALRIVHEDQIR
jgi:purine catabolism regulator